MIKLYLAVTIFIFLAEALIHLNKIMTSMYPRRSPLISKNDDKTYFVMYLIFIIYGLWMIFTI